MKGDTWLYHRTEAPTLVMASAVPSMLAQGWADTPAAFYEVTQTYESTPDPAPAIVADVPRRRGRPVRTKGDD